MTTLSAKDLGTIGPTYEITEQDMEEYIRNKLTGLDWEKTMQEIIERTRKQIIPKGTLLPKVQKEKSFHINPANVLEDDIRDEKGNILYPKGYTYNPLDYSPFTRKYLFIDGEDPDQLEIANRYEDELGDEVVVLLINGNPFEIMEGSNLNIYFADEKVINGFQIKRVPSLVSQDGKLIKIDEIVK